MCVHVCYIQCVLHTVCAIFVTVFVLSEWSKQCALMCVSACLDVLM